MSVSQPRVRAMPLMCIGDGAALSTERTLEQQKEKQQEQSLGAADSSQFPANARHGKDSLQHLISRLTSYNLGFSMDELLQ